MWLNLYGPALALLGAAHPNSVPAEALRYASRPLSFEVNRGQTDARVKFLARGSDYVLFLTVRQAIFKHRTLARPVRMTFSGANPAPALEGLDPEAGYSNYILGSDRHLWQERVPRFARVRYGEIYPGIDLLFYRGRRGLEFDFVLRPGADPSRIRLAFDGLRGLHIDAAGDLVLRTEAGDLRQHKPEVYQDREGRRAEVEGRYRVLPGRQIAFQVGAYDRSQPLVIDPVLSYSTFLGGSAADQILGAAVDPQGDAYVTGYTASANFPTSSGAPDASFRGGDTDVFVAKLSADGRALVYSTYLGGNASDQAVAIAVDAIGNAYIAGNTSSANFPTTPAAYQTAGAGIFVAKLNPAGTQLVYSTYMGGGTAGPGSVQALALDGSGNAYLAGFTYADNFPVTAGVVQMQRRGWNDAFVAKLSASGSSLMFSTLLGGSSTDAATAVAVDPEGSVYVTGFTESADFPTSAAGLQTTRHGYRDAFVTKLNSAGTAVVYSTLLGGPEGDGGTSVAVDPSGSAYVSGYASVQGFPVTVGAFQTMAACCGSVAGFVSKLVADGGSLAYSTYFGLVSTAARRPLSLALDPSGNAYLAGRCSGVPATSGALQPLPAGGHSDGCLGILDATGGVLLYATYLGGTAEDHIEAIRLGATGDVYLAGSTDSPDFPISQGVVQPRLAGASDGFLIRIGVQAGACTYALSATGQSFAATGGAGAFQVTAPAGCAWAASANAAWLTITGGAGGNGNGTISFSVAASNSSQTRSAGFDVAGQTFTITQAGAPCVYTLQPAGRSFLAAGGASSFSVQAPAGCPWAVTGGAPWIALGIASGNGMETVSFSVSQNTGPARSAILSVAGQDFTIAQASGSANCSYALSQNSVSMAAGGGTGSVSVTATAGCPWTAASNTGWIAISAGASGSGSGSVAYAIAANGTGSARTSSLTIAGQLYTVWQPPRSAGDLDGNGTPDLLWQHEATGQITVNYYATGPLFQGWAALSSGVAGWQVAAAADFDRNSVVDLVWQNSTTRQVTVNYYGGAQGTTLIGWAWLNPDGIPGWTVAAAADFDRNGVPDLVWVNDATHQVTVNFYGGPQGSTLQGWAWLNSAGVPGWRLAAVADWDANGVPDLVWQNLTTRQVTVNYYSGAQGATLAGWAWLNRYGIAGWSVCGAADFDGNGVPDLLWQNDTTRQITVNNYGGSDRTRMTGWGWVNNTGFAGWRAATAQ